MHIQNVESKFSYKLIKNCVNFCTIFGFCPFKFNGEKMIFELTFFHYLYSIVFYISFTYLYLTSGLTIILKLNPLAMISFICLSMIAITVTFIASWFNAPRMVRLFNEDKYLLIALCSACDYSKIFRETILLILCQICIVSAIAQIAVIYGCSISGNLVTGHVDYFVILVISIAYILQTIVPNIFYITVLLASYFHGEMNRNILNLMNEMDKIRINEKLNILCKLHFRLTEVMNKINSISSIQLLFSTADFIAILSIEVCYVTVI